MTGVWWQVICSSTTDQTFAIGERVEGRGGQHSSKIFSVPRKVRTIPWTSGHALSCWNVAFHKTQIKGRATGRNTTETQWPLFKLQSMQTRGDQEVYPKVLHTVTPDDEPVWWCRIDTGHVCPPRCHQTGMRASWCSKQNRDSSKKKMLHFQYEIET